MQNEDGIALNALLEIMQRFDKLRKCDLLWLKERVTIELKAKETR